MKKQEKLYSLFSMSLLIVAGTAFAAPSLPIPDVVGHKPTVDNVRIDKVPPVTGDTLNILYDYQDIVGDIDASGQDHERFLFKMLQLLTRRSWCDLMPSF